MEQGGTGPMRGQHINVGPGWPKLFQRNGALAAQEMTVTFWELL